MIQFGTQKFIDQRMRDAMALENCSKSTLKRTIEATQGLGASLVGVPGQQISSSFFFFFFLIFFFFFSEEMAVFNRNKSLSG